ncbi:acyl-CoA synthetase [Salibacterium halotolerans]|uniref:Acetyl-CoA synthetase n=1 Tax=Salibacterium halotolerans TaxID=1884432 RepID=A0A1I5TD01_9BACI|nr:acyl--CoA ligase [Salibacterium halotolerans]SFP80711.1 acetyl-CoA synthetase [Salibacterium halotolerans]
MKGRNLIAPDTYNITDDLERFAGDETRTAVRWLDENQNRINISYAELVRKTNQYANTLIGQGFQKGDRLLLMFPRLPEAYMIHLACLKAGITAVPCSAMLRAKDLVYRIHHAKAKGIAAFHNVTEEMDSITEPLPSLKHKFVLGGEKEGWTTFEPLTKEHPETYQGEKTKREDMAFLSYTSGTTGHPKAVVHTHGWAYAHVRTAAREWLDVREGDIVWATAAPGWQKWIWSPLLSTITLGATAFVYHGRFDPETYLELLQNEGVHALCCTPTEYRLMAKVEQLERYDLGKLRSTVSAGEPLNRQVIETFKQAFDADVRDGYGQTENTLLVGTLTGMEIKPGSMGKPTPGNPVDIIDENGTSVPAGEAGDIAVHKDCPALFKEYFKEPERTQDTFRGDWYLTGDQAFRDEDGYFWFEGRSDDIIISSGYTIGPFEVEDALNSHEAVKECAVTASPDEIRGNVVKAFVVLKEQPSPGTEDNLKKELQDHTKELTAPYKYPRRIQFVEDLPKTNTGKIRRIDLRRQDPDRKQ